MASHVCPQKEHLSAYAFGTLDESQAREVAEHVEQCPACDQTLQSLDREGDTLIAQLREPSTADPFLAETGFQKRLPVVESMAGDPALLLSGAAAQPSLSTEGLPQLREYRLLAKLGEGGMGAVYKALHTRLDKVVAVKVLPSGRLKDPAVVARFEREMKAIGRLEHPNVIRAHDAGEADGVHFLVMEYLDGADLSRVVDHVGPLPVADACELVRQAALGLEYAHQQGLVHRDVKPSNLMLTTEGEVKVLDLGLARLSDQDVPAGAELTSTGQMMGTFDYMAPEQGSDTHKVDIRADIYSLGATIYKLLCGEAPFAGESFNTPMKKMLALATKDPPPLIERRPDVPEALAGLVRGMLAKSPADRPAIPRDVAVALAPFTTGHDLKRLAAQAACGTLPGFGAAAPLLKTEPYASSAQVDTTPRKSAALETAPRSGRPRWVIAASAAVLACLVLAAITIYRIQTAEGTIVVKLDDADNADIEAKLKDGGVQIVDLAKQRSYLITPAASKNVPAGKYTARAGAEDLQLRVTDDAGVEMATGEFSLRRGGKLIVHVSLVLTSPAPVQAAKDPGQLERNPRDLERRALEWALRNGATLTFTERGTIRTLQVRGPDGKLPGDDYDLWQLTLAPTTTDADLDNIKPIRSLRYLSLSYCSKITDAGLERIRDLTDLDWLDLPGTGISDAGLSALAGMTKLTWVTLDRTQISDKGIDTLSRTVPQLNTLRCVGTRVSSIKPFLPLKKIQILDVPPLRDPQDYARLAEFPELLGFKVGGRGLTDETLRFFPHFPATFRHLSLWDGELDGSGLKELTALPELERLTISGCRLTDASLRHLHGASRLTDLYLINMPLTDAALEHLFSLKQLRKLDLRVCKMTDAGIARFRERVPACVVTLDGVVKGAAPTVDSDAESAERRAAEWLLSIGGAVFTGEVGVGSITKYTGPGSRLPDGPLKFAGFELSRREFSSADFDRLKPLVMAKWVRLIGLTIDDDWLEALGQMKQLKMLQLVDSPLSRAGLATLDRFPALWNLSLQGSGLTDDEIPILGKLGALTSLDISNNPITDAGLAALSQTLPNLQRLVLGGTKVKGPGLDRLRKLGRLNQLHISALGDKDDYARLAKLESLTWLDLTGESMTDEQLLLLPPLPRLHVLALSECAVRGPGLARLQAMPALTQFFARKCPLTNDGLRHLQNCPLLDYVQLDNVEVDDAGLEFLKSIKDFKQLYVTDTEITADGAARFQKTLPNSKVFRNGRPVAASVLPAEDRNPDRRAAEWVISLGGAVQVASADNAAPMVFNVASLPTGAFKIRLVFLNNPRKKTDDAGLANLAGLDELESLNLTLAGPFTIAGMRHLSGLTSLKDLTIWSAPLTDAGFAPLLALPNLETLTLYDVQFTDAGLPQLAGLKSLRHLYLGDNPMITDDGAAALAGLQRLESLTLYKLRISDVGLERLLALPRLTALQLNHVDVTEAGLALVGSKTKLFSLGLDRLPVTNAGLKSLESLRSLKQLSLNDTEVTLDGAAALQRVLPECSIHWNEAALMRMAGSPDRRAAVWVVSRGGMVTMSGTGTDEIEVKTLADLPSVQSGSKVWKVFLQNARLRMYEGDLLRLTPLKELESLDLIGAGHFSPFAMQSLAGFKELKSLRLADSSIGDEGLAHLHGLTKLEHLAVSNSKITNAGLARLAGMKQLSTLNIGGNDITDEGAATLAAFLKLENLDLTHTSITDQGLERLLMLPELTQLSIGRTRITEAGVKSLGAKSQLTRLALQNIPVSDATLAALEPLGNLEVLDLKGTRVTAVGIERLQKALPKCKIEWTAPN